LPSHIEKIEIKNPDKSLNICAASDKIASDAAYIPPKIYIVKFLLSYLSNKEY
jgi:hypothetical protein